MLSPLFAASLILAVPTLSAASGDVKATKSAKGNLVIVQPGEMDLGKISSSKIQTFKITLENTGKDLVIVRGIDVSCGCTAVVLPQNNRLEAGQTLDVPVTFNPHGFFGYVTKTLTVQSSDPAQASFQWNFHATIETPVLLQPKAVSLTAVEDDVQPVSQEFAFLPATSALKVKKIHLESSSAQQPEMTWKMVNGEIRGKVTLDPKRWNAAQRAKDRGIFHPDKIVLELEDGFSDFIQVYWNLQPVVNVNPRQVALLGAVGARLAADANLNSADPFKVLKIKSSLPDKLEATAEAGADGHFTVIHVAWKGQTTGTYSERLTIYTDNPRFPEVEIPVNVAIN